MRRRDRAGGPPPAARAPYRDCQLESGPGAGRGARAHWPDELRLSPTLVAGSMIACDHDGLAQRRCGVGAQAEARRRAVALGAAGHSGRGDGQGSVAVAT